MFFFTLIGVGVFIYGLVYTVVLCLLDCDLQLAFYEKFGKSVRRLKGKVAFITGASSGIGEHLAVALAKNGVKLALAARRRDELERVKRNCLAASGEQLKDSDVLVIPMDMLDFDSHRKHFDHAVRHFGTVDILINNAGRSQRALWEEIDVKVDQEMFNLNVFSTLNLSRVALKHFNAKGGGQIAVTSSVAGFIPAPFSATYTGSKYAIHGYYNSLRSEKIGRGITVSIFCPGPTFTNFLQNSFTAKQGEQYGVSVKPTDRRMTAERCGQLCAVALANKLPEAWMGVFPMIPFSYLVVYFPLVHYFLLKTVGPEKLYKLRDSKDNPPLTEVQIA